MSKEIGLTVKKSEDFSEWYTQVVLKAELADYAPVKGFMVLRPYGYAIWERIREYFDYRITKLGHKNAYFPALIPESLLRKEAEHFKGFVPEVFWVTQAGNDTIGERLAIRPTSETIVYASYSKWVRSWRDLPLLLNTWNSVMRAEIKGTKPFLRTSEFLWQEGHTVHATKEEADQEVMTILTIYEDLVTKELAIPALKGTKTEREKFVGALYTTTLETLMPDGKALQMGTSHNLGQNFSKPFEITYLGKDGQSHFAWQTSWGVSWRLIGAVIMMHGDDKGLVLPPRLAPIQVVIVPIYYSEADKKKVFEKANRINRLLNRKKIRVHFDDREGYTPGWKFNEWELKGVPLRLEIGPKDVASQTVTLARRDIIKKAVVTDSKISKEIADLLEEIQKNMLRKAEEYLEKHILTANDYSAFKKEIEAGGFLRANWCGDTSCEASIKEETGADIRLLPLSEEKVFANCIYCGKEGKKVVYFARAY